MKIVNKNCEACSQKITGVIMPETVGRKNGKPVFAYFCKDCYDEIQAILKEREENNNLRMEYEDMISSKQEQIRCLRQQDNDLFERNKQLNDKLRDINYDVACYVGAVWPKL